ncbi:ATP-binding cassette domain-containing protein [Flammeovirga yaeyamensis]|uniref:ATP-binding cassette domain-containing protein n=1 Tax=Flammeovirga yaeyamensis TaxID=367791 RepID=A0AAX1N5Q6_9BACT|nr:ATP-binding cassette domain-containing protein [Flammeovirga yaeyamensis]MBB3698068.1 ABC-2 type transport system ATP-binding protein [Flammeovirga yaeyamensis]NMF34573.1 ATP-binding cassette domain-containing protein [Flammeovirga yaeyamensis]QWG01550.1 ATP-binding cassette domain-containing protein [Flammeovirga yaeyamensis]
MIHTEKLIKKYGDKTALSVETLDIKKNEIVGLVGNNGAGKTTFLSLLLDLIKATDGEIKIKDSAVSKSEEWKKYTGSFLDDSFLVPFMTSLEYLEFVANLHQWKKGDLDEFLTQNKAFYGDDFLTGKKMIKDLSKGNKNKTGILGALIGNPELLILDEPFANLDPTSQQWLRLKIQKLSEEGVTAIVSSHDLQHVTGISSRIVMLEDGQVAKDVENTESTLEELESYFGAKITEESI